MLKQGTRNRGSVVWRGTHKRKQRSNEIKDDGCVGTGYWFACLFNCAMHLVSRVCPVFSGYSISNYFNGWGLSIWHVCGVQSQTTGSRCPCFCAAATAVNEERDISWQLLTNAKTDYLGSRIIVLCYVYLYPRGRYLDEFAIRPWESWTTARETVRSGD